MSSFRQGCEAVISLSLSEDRQSLFIREMKDDHNHPMGLKKSFDHLPQKRKLNNASVSKVRKPLTLKVNKKLFQEKIAKPSGDKVLLTDLANIVKGTGEDENNLDACINILQEEHSCQVDVLINEDNIFKGMFIQDQTMRDCFQSFPEILFVDSTYKCLQIEGAVYLFVVEDSMGNSEIVSIGILMLEDTESLNWLTVKFKERNPTWEATSVIMSNKSAMERIVFGQQFPLAQVLICTFNSLNIFKREVTCAELGITPAEETLAKEYLDKVINCKSLIEYDQVYEEMIRTLPLQVMTYYEHWHAIKEQWVPGLLHKSGNFYNITNNRIELLHNRLKNIIPKLSSLKDFFKFLFIELQIQRNEHDHKALKMLHKVPVHKYPEDSPIVQYMNLLTYYSFKYVEQQFALVGRVNKEFEEYEDGDIVVNTSAGKLVVSEDNCECSFNVSMGLPCRHILFVRHYKGLDLFDDRLCLERWTKTYYNSNHQALRFQSRDVDDSPNSAAIIPLSRRANQPLSTAHKYRRLMDKAAKLAALGSKASTSVYEQRCKTLDKIIHYWENWEEVSVSKSVDGKVDKDN